MRARIQTRSLLVIVRILIMCPFDKTARIYCPQCVGHSKTLLISHYTDAGVDPSQLLPSPNECNSHLAWATRFRKEEARQLMSKVGTTAQSGASVVWSTRMHFAPLPLGSAGWAAAKGFDELGKEHELHREKKKVHDDTKSAEHLKQNARVRAPSRLRTTACVFA